MSDAENDHGTLPVRLPSGDRRTAKFTATTAPPWALVVTVEGLPEVRVEDQDLFSCLMTARGVFGRAGVQLLCQGARRDVYPSAMSREMSGGRMAYVLTPGEPGRRDRVVDIFAPLPPEAESRLADADEQRGYYTSWLESLAHAR